MALSDWQQNEYLKGDLLTLDATWMKLQEMFKDGPTVCDCCGKTLGLGDTCRMVHTANGGCSFAGVCAECAASITFVGQAFQDDFGNVTVF